MEFLRAFIANNPILATSLASLWGAVVLDLISFSKAKEPGNFFAQFSFSTALWKYLQAFVAGFVGNVTIAAAAGTVAAIIWIW